MAFNSEFDGESAASKDVCVCERIIAFCVYKGWAVLCFASMDV